ncbi:MAG TPA: sigma-70 family RNA polymerase sigma factor [Blastocatellia bacterium]|nr:sigma-70 family RNA polymerase sigma factor [Blastocatellia bacterium]
MAGDALAEEELVHHYKVAVSIIIARIVQNHFSREDIFQETFKKALEKIRRGDVREPERLSGFVCAIARNLAIEYVRNPKHLVREADATTTRQISDSAPDPFEHFRRKEKAEIVRQVIKELKMERDRKLLFRYYIAEEDKDQICADLALTREQFNGVIFRALKRFKELYVKRVGES